jgi:anti-sigma factor ChrR (cupin superfamily)
MNDDLASADHGEWAALYAAGALPADEEARYEAHVAAGCARCQAELRDLDAVIRALAEGIAPAVPQPATRQAVLQRLASPAAPSPLREHLQPAPAPVSPDVLTIQRAASAEWQPSAVAGVSIRVLHVDADNNQFTALVRMAPGASYPAHVHRGPEQCLVLEGDLHVGEEIMGPGDYQLASSGSRHGVQHTRDGCLLFIVSSLTDEFD